MKFLNIWRPILQTMLFLVSKRRKVSVEGALRGMLRNVKELDILIYDIFGMQ